MLFNIKNQPVFCLPQREIGPFLGSWVLKKGFFMSEFSPEAETASLKLLKNIVLSKSFLCSVYSKFG